MPDLQFSPPSSRCILCDSPELGPGYSIEALGATIAYSACRDCGFVFQNPRLTPGSVRDAYRAMDYWNTAYHDYLEGDGIRKINSRNRLHSVLRVAGIGPGGRLLDIGSATGIFAVAAREAGFQVLCVEPSEEIAAAGRKAYGLDFVVNTWDAAEIEPGTYDMVTLWGTDSHFLEPLPAFRKIAAALRPGGILAMNYQDFSHPIRRIFPKMKTGATVMYNLDDRSFRKLMDVCGFEVVGSKLEWQRVSIGHVMRAVRMPAPAWVDHIVLPVPAFSFRAIVARKR